MHCESPSTRNSTGWWGGSYRIPRRFWLIPDGWWNLGEWTRGEGGQDHVIRCTTAPSHGMPRKQWLRRRCVLEPCEWQTINVHRTATVASSPNSRGIIISVVRWRPPSNVCEPVIPSGSDAIIVRDFQSTLSTSRANLCLTIFHYWRKCEPLPHRRRRKRTEIIRTTPSPTIVWPTTPSIVHFSNRPFPLPYASTTKSIIWFFFHVLQMI